MAPDSGSGPLLSLALVLLQTFSALGLGYLCIRAKFIDPDKGEMGALRFYVGWIGLPLLVFEKLATASLGDISWSVVLACNLAKLVVYATTFAMTFVAYKSQRSYGQRVLTATTFSFFAVASNDLAIGFPVIHAMYGPSMEVYISANVFVFQVFFQPLTMILFEVGSAWRSLEEGHHETMGLPVLLRNAGKGILQNVVILATLLGVSYQLLLGSGGKAPPGSDKRAATHFPHPLEDVISLWTAPFTFLFLFLNGASLSKFSLGFWSALLVLMKVVACAYLSRCLGAAMLPDGQADLRNFTFFYGSIPAGGAPLVFAAIFDPACVGIVAAASLYCLLLAGPIELVTALYLARDGIQMHEVRQVQFDTVAASAACSGALLLLLLLARKAAPAWITGCYGATVLLYNVVTVIMQRMDDTCGTFLWERLFGFLQIACCLLVLYMQCQLTRRKPASFAHLPVLALLTLLLALALPYFNTLDDLCLDTPDAGIFEQSLLLVWNMVLLLTSCGLTIWAMVLKRQVRARTASADGMGLTRLADGATPVTARAEERRERFAEGGGGIALALVVLQAMRLLMEVVNLLIKIIGKMNSASRGFTPMFMLVNVLEHGQGAILLTVAIFNGELGTMLHAILRPCTVRPSPELPAASSLGSICEQGERGCISLPGSISLPSSMPTAERRGSAGAGSGRPRPPASLT